MVPKLRLLKFAPVRFTFCFCIHTKIVCLILFCVLRFLQGRSQNGAASGYEIRVSFRPVTAATVYLGRYFNGEIPVLDSALLNEKGEAVFAGDSVLPGGIYVLFFPYAAAPLDVLVDKEQKFSVQADYTNPESPLIHFSHSPENVQMHSYIRFMETIGKKMDEQAILLETAATHQELDQLIRSLEKMNDSIHRFREQLIKKNPGTLLGLLFTAMREPVLPDTLKTIRTPGDSARAAQYRKTHYWEGVPFWDSRLAYTPFLPDKLDKYVSEIIDKDEDSVIAITDRLLAEAAASKPMTRLLLSRLIRGSMEHIYKWGDAVLIHLFEKYIVNRSYSWLDETERQRITERAYFLMGKMTGTPAPGIRLPGIDSVPRSLYDIKADYILVGFWDPTCSHCLETLPRLDSAYRAGWWARGLKIFAIGHESDGTRNDWLGYIRDQQLTDWVHVYHTQSDENKRTADGLMGYLKLYDVWYYPSFFLLDSSKRFLAKKLPAKDMIAFIDYLVSGNKSR